MHARSFRFDSTHFQGLSPRRNRRAPLLGLAFGLVGLAVLAVLVFFGVFIGAAMLAVGLAWRLLRRPAPRTRTNRAVMDAEYRVLRKQQLPTPR